MDVPIIINNPSNAAAVIYGPIDNCGKKERRNAHGTDVAKATASPSLLWLGMIFYLSRLRETSGAREKRVESKRLRVNER